MEHSEFDPNIVLELTKVYPHRLGIRSSSALGNHAVASGHLYGRSIIWTWIAAPTDAAVEAAAVEAALPVEDAAAEVVVVMAAICRLTQATADVSMTRSIQGLQRKSALT